MVNEENFLAHVQLVGGYTTVNFGTVGQLSNVGVAVHFSNVSTIVHLWSSSLSFSSTLDPTHPVRLARRTSSPCLPDLPVHSGSADFPFSLDLPPIPGHDPDSSPNPFYLRLQTRVPDPSPLFHHSTHLKTRGLLPLTQDADDSILPPVWTPGL